MMSRAALEFPQNGFKRLSDDEVEEEEKAGYNPEKFYPVRIGEVFQSRYQVVAKLGFGLESTVWLCRDLKHGDFKTLKVCTLQQDNSKGVNREIAVYQRVNSAHDLIGHPGKEFLRLVLDSFKITGPYGRHQCLLFKPMAMSLCDYTKMLPGGVLDKNMLRWVLDRLLCGLDFLHRAGVVHTDLSPFNILLETKDTSIFTEIEQRELETPCPRKVLQDRTIYRSVQPTYREFSSLAICDFGRAEIGDTHSEYAMPQAFQAPEIIMSREWGSKIDVWSVGVMIWDLFEGRLLFCDGPEEVTSEGQHLAEMISLMGPAPSKFLDLDLMDKAADFWDDEGNWLRGIPIPDQSLETLETRLKGQDQAVFLAFIRRMLRWCSEDRPTCQELRTDEFITNHNKQAASIVYSHT